jgi:hypothetical protein
MNTYPIAVTSSSSFKKRRRGFARAAVTSEEPTVNKKIAQLKVASFAGGLVGALQEALS